MAVEPVLTFATEGILTKLTSLVSHEISLAWGFKAELGKLNESLSILQDFLGGAAEKAQDGGKPVEGWVKKLKDIADEADDVLEEINYEFLRRRVELHNHMGKKVLNFLSASNPILFRQKMGHRIRKISASLADLKSEASYIGLIAKKKDATPQRIREDRETNAFISKDEIIIGRKDVVSDIVTTLTNSNMNQENLSVMAIAGMPGLGKTTLAKSVYNEGAIDVYFNKKLWVCVSNTFNVNSILTAMLELLSGKVATTSQQALLTNLREELSGKRYFLVLDDVWNEESEKWERLKSCLSKLNSAPGSKIIVTTRSGIVASLTETLPRPKLDLLSTDECWSILKHAACSDGSSDIERIGREIAKNCEGLPLMAQVLGGILHSKKTPAEWSEVKDNRIWDLPKTEDRIMSVLKLSFDNLESPALKQCFSYCSAFMKDDEMERDDLIQLWMAQGFLHPSSETSNLEMEDIESVSEIGSMMRDFHKIEDIATPIIVPDGSSGKLRTLFSNVEALLGNMLLWFKALRVLKLYGAHIKELPISIGKLKHLRYLDISRTGIKRLPNSIGKLYNVQTLRATTAILKNFQKTCKT
ncbi:putative disease resistance protein RGA1 isoform X2 [Prunus avium]|uniref:Disease resistance protein RGA1 isoform X2 n=1 Tax=Prunus avium TaxID=42229 RepID=A0A6P5RAT0_PRUAV|nr:putative disease resistance protein RGA1 isoform X2 [Prunus avium]